MAYGNPLCQEKEKESMYLCWDGHHKDSTTSPLLYCCWPSWDTFLHLLSTIISTKCVSIRLRFWLRWRIRGGGSVCMQFWAYIWSKFHCETAESCVNISQTCFHQILLSTMWRWEPNLCRNHYLPHNYHNHWHLLPQGKAREEVEQVKLL